MIRCIKLKILTMRLTVLWYTIGYLCDKGHNFFRKEYNKKLLKRLVDKEEELADKILTYY